MNKIKYYFLNLYPFDFLRKIISILNRYINMNFIRKIKSVYFFKSVSLKMGKNIRVFGQIYDVKIADLVIFQSNCIFEFGYSSKFKVGYNSYLSYGVIISCQKSITIGENVQIGEYTSIRDSTHDYTNNGKAMKYNKDIVKEIIIGNNVWIGRNCYIAPGTVIEDGVVVGANSLIKGVLKANSIYAGTPLRPIRERVKG